MSLPTFSFSTTADDVARVFAGEIRGKNVLITGTSLNGIGFDTALAIAKHANLIIITGYNSDRLKLSEDAIKKEVPSANVRRLTLDLSSLAAVRTAAAEVNAYPEPLHVLIHNASAPVGPFRVTPDNLELQMATDHIGPFLLTKLLASKLMASGTTSYVPRVVFVSSGAQAYGTGVNFSTISAPDPEKAVKALEGQDQRVQSSTPELVTAIVSNMNQKEEAIPYMQAYGADGNPNTEEYVWKTLQQGAATTVAAAFDTRLNDKPGAYLSDSTEVNKNLAPHSSDPTIAEKLWSVTEEIVGERFNF
ncbi:hypothetical protein DFH09DRAFT_1087119 [Mycena vulgaris]|nr:hypothetical protein DFH09DRAFT_1087119 [Mycena vulgaris]